MRHFIAAASLAVLAGCQCEPPHRPQLRPSALCRLLHRRALYDVSG